MKQAFFCVHPLDCHKKRMFESQYIPLKVMFRFVHMFFSTIHWGPSSKVWFQILSKMAQVVFMLTARMCNMLSYIRLWTLGLVTTLLWKLATFLFINETYLRPKIHYANLINMRFLLIPKSQFSWSNVDNDLILTKLFLKLVGITSKQCSMMIM